MVKIGIVVIKNGSTKVVTDVRNDIKRMSESRRYVKGLLSKTNDIEDDVYDIVKIGSSLYIKKTDKRTRDYNNLKGYLEK